VSTQGGSGKIHIWNLSKLKVTGNDLAGDETRSCGTRLPEFTLGPGGSVVAGGNKVHIEIPDTVWDAPTIPRFRSVGKLTGWNPGSPFAIEGTIALVGLTMDDPLAAWPTSYTAIKAVDADGDGKPGFTAVPKTMNGYVNPPAGLGIAGMGPKADRLYLASRTVVSLDGKLSSCNEVAGTANVRFFDSRVVGCRNTSGADCSAREVDFVDTSKTEYKVGAATFVAKTVPDNATCEDVRKAVPAPGM
jgi:hypothetical protein